jgi:hypothetical protein
LSDAATHEELRAIALRYVADRAVQYLLQVGEPAKTGQVTGFVAEDQPVSAKVVRDALTLDGRFIQRDRRWDLAAREIDPQRPVERTIDDFLRAVGRPLTVETIGVEIAKATGVSPEGETDTVRRLVGHRPGFVLLDEDRVSPADWVLDISAGNPEDVLFDNFDDEDEVTAMRGHVPEGEWSNPVEASRHLIQTLGAPVSGMAMAYLAYEQKPDGFDPIAFHKALLASHLIRLSDGTWITQSLVDALGPAWERLADEPAVEGAPEEAVRAAGGEVAITPADMEEIEVLIRRADGLITSRQILEQVLEINANDPDYDRWEATLGEALQTQGELINVGWDRWRKFETIPTDILDLPESLQFKEYSFQTMEGEELDVELNEDGLDGNLRDLIRTPLATLGGECVTQEDGGARCTTTVLHHANGTLPTIGDNPYFPAEPLLLEATIIGPGGRFPLWINNSLGLAFGLKKLYADLPPSGAVFFLQPGTRKGEYHLDVGEVPDPAIGIDDARVKELRGIAERPGIEDVSTFDLVGELLSRQRKGAEFQTLLAEVWFIRPVTAQLVASLLSEYYCFKQNKTGTWSFDPREVDKGFKKSKRKYVK